jgi:hypothetical protein
MWQFFDVTDASLCIIVKIGFSSHIFEKNRNKLSKNQLILRIALIVIATYRIS